MKRVAIIGAGISGLACARQLVKEGVEIVVFEKSRSLGGRCASRSWEGCVFDHGAQFFTARSPDFQSYLEELGASVEAIEAPVIDELGDLVGVDSRRLYHVEGNNRLARELAAGLAVRRETVIDQIADRLVAGESFDAVVSSAPWPQTAAMLGITTAASPYERNLTAAFLYDLPWIGRARETYAMSDRSGSALAWSACENHKMGRVPEGRTLFVGQASPEFSAKHYDAPRDAWSQRLQTELEEKWKLDSTRRAGIFAHRWGFARRVVEAQNVILPEGVHVCGDTLGESRIEDVWLSGHALARKLLES